MELRQNDEILFLIVGIIDQDELFSIYYDRLN